MRFRAAASLALIALACSGSERRTSTEVVLRVSASHGLGILTPGPSLDGASSYASDLVYEPLAAHAAVIRRDGVIVRLSRAPTSPYSAEVIAERLRYEDLVSATASGEEIIVEFSREESAALFAEGSDLAVAVGPYEVAEQSPTKVRLQARSDRAIDAIEIVSVPEEQQWRRLLGRDVDVVPAADEVLRRYLADVSSIRTVELAVNSLYALVLNAQDAALKPRAVRAGIARGIDTRAVASLACGSPECALGGAPEVVRASDDLVLPGELTILVLESEHTALLTARVLRHQLRKIGVGVTVDAEPLEQFSRRHLSGAFQAMLVPLRSGDDRALVHRLSTAGYTSSEISAALERRDYAAARALLRSEIAYVPLYEARQFAAFDGHFCGGHPESVTSWRWLAELHPCKDGESR